MLKFRQKIITTALLVAGGALLFVSCGKKQAGEEPNYETMLTQQSDTLTIVSSSNGVKQYRFYTPLMERYELAREPYMEFRYGVDVITYDSLGSVESTLVADYAIYYETRKLWEGRGNVVAHSGERTLYTQQLFWDEKTDKVYSNVDSKVIDGKSVNIAKGGFVSDSKFERWEFVDNESRMWVDVSTVKSEPRSDSTTVDGVGTPDMAAPNQIKPTNIPKRSKPSMEDWKARQVQEQSKEQLKKE